MELIRSLLLKLETFDKDPGSVIHIYPLLPELAVEGYSEAEIEYHLTLMDEAGFFENLDQPMQGFLFRRLSWSGHDFLDAARNNRVWSEAKHIIAEKGGSLPFDVVKLLLVELAKRALFGG